MQMTAAFSWIIEPDEKIDVMTEDGVNIAIYAHKASDHAGAVDVAPRFRYIIRVNELSQADFPAAAARLLFAASLLALPYTVEAGNVSAVALTTLSQKCIRITHGPQSKETEARVQTTWTTQPYRHHRAAAPRQRCFSASEAQSSSVS